MTWRLRIWACSCLAGLLLTGCATSTVATRTQERSAAYATLSPEFKTAVDQGEIKVGMTMDAVYIAWGKPAQVLNGEAAPGVQTVTWLYQGCAIQEYRYWRYGPFYSGFFYPDLDLATDYYPRYYIKAEIIFENGAVKQWRSLSEPGH